MIKLCQAKGSKLGNIWAELSQSSSSSLSISTFSAQGLKSNIESFKISYFGQFFYTQPNSTGTLLRKSDNLTILNWKGKVAAEVFCSYWMWGSCAWYFPLCALLHIFRTGRLFIRDFLRITTKKAWISFDISCELVVIFDSLSLYLK